MYNGKFKKMQNRKQIKLKMEVTIFLFNKAAFLHEIHASTDKKSYHLIEQNIGTASKLDRTHTEIFY